MCNGSGSSLRKASLHSRDEPNTLRHKRNQSCLCQALERKVKLAIAEAKPLLDASASGNGMTCNQLERAADELKATIESVLSAGLGESHSLVKEATQLDKTLRNKVTKTKVSAVHVV